MICRASSSAYSTYSPPGDDTPSVANTNARTIGRVPTAAIAVYLGLCAFVFVSFMYVVCVLAYVAFQVIVKLLSFLDFYEILYLCASILVDFFDAATNKVVGSLALFCLYMCFITAPSFF